MKKMISWILSKDITVDILLILGWVVLAFYPIYKINFLIEKLYITHPYIGLAVLMLYLIVQMILIIIYFYFATELLKRFKNERKKNKRMD